MMKLFIRLISILLLFPFCANAQYHITSIGGSSYSGTLADYATIYLCNGSGIGPYSDVPSQVTVGTKTYYKKWQTSGNGSSWFTNSFSPTATTDMYIRCCNSYSSSSTDIINATPWVYIKHSNIQTVDAPFAYAATDFSTTSFTANWRNTFAVDNTGGGLLVKTKLGYSLIADMSSGVTWIDVTNTSLAGQNQSYTITGLQINKTYYWRVWAGDYNTHTNSYNYAEYNYDWFCCVSCQGQSAIQSQPTCIALAITSQPLSQTACSAQAVSFSVSTDTAPPVSYQWQKNGGNISSATNSNYFINNLSLGDIAAYDCVISNSCSSVTSDNAALSVNTLPVVSSQPADVSHCAGTNASFSFSASGTDPLFYQWYKNGTNLSGQTNSQFSISSSQLSDSGMYYCIASDICGNISSSAATLNINNPPVITSQTPDRIKCTRDSVMFKTTISNQISACSYQWSKDGNDITGATKSSYLISLILPGDYGNYSCLISNTCGNTSAAIALAVNASAYIRDTIPNQYICEGGSATFSIHAAGSNLSYQWTKGGSNISGATNTVVSFGNLMLSDADIYSCVVTNSCGSKLLKPFLLIIDQKPVVNITPININKSIGDSVLYILSPLGSPPFRFQWMKDNNIINGATNNPFKIKPITLNDAGAYSCIINNECGSSAAQVGSLIVNNAGYTINGNLTYDNKTQTPIINSEVFLETSDGLKIDSASTDNNGAFMFSNIFNGSYLITCKINMAWGGSNPLDALLINRNYIGTYTFSDALKGKAADVDINGKINPLDALSINRRFIGVINKFPAPNWIYDAFAITVNDSDPDFIMIKAICSGDADGSYAK